LDQEAEPVGLLVEIHQQITGGLGDACAGRVGGDPGQVNPTMVEFDHE
jgi:hypothetical protein